MIVKKLALIAAMFVITTNYAAAQQQHNWYLGLQGGSSYYQLYNRIDWQADPILIYPVVGTVNSSTIGATITYTWGKHLGLGSGLLYNKCKQDFSALKDPGDPDPIFAYSITNEFNYIRVPVNIEFSSNNNATHQLVASLGLQTAFLVSYKEHFLQKATGFYSEAEYYAKTGHAISDNVPDLHYTKYLYNRFLFGINSKIGYRLKVSDGWLFEAGIAASYDITNAENRSAKVVSTDKYFWTTGIKRYGYSLTGGDRPKTHNRSVGFYISVSIPLSTR